MIGGVRLLANMDVGFYCERYRCKMTRQVCHKRLDSSRYKYDCEGCVINVRLKESFGSSKSSLGKSKSRN
jgi:hypothetical protein